MKSTSKAYKDMAEYVRKIEAMIDNDVYSRSPHDETTQKYLDKEWRRIHKKANGDFTIFLKLAFDFCSNPGCTY